jgi:uncharacterized protein (DUF1697 family)
MVARRRYAALLRGVNVGGRAKLPMAELAAALTTLGHEDVRTYIQSGNVALTARGSRQSTAAAIERTIDERFGLEVRVLLRTHEELAAIAAGDPFADAARGEVHIVFLERAPSQAAAGALDPQRSPGDSFALAGQEVYLHLPSGAGRTKLTLAYLERQLGVAGTQRNWNTLVKLIELTAPPTAV